MAKYAEARWKSIANNYGWRTHKYGDVRYCIVCHAPQPKSEHMPDYLTAAISTLIEVKNNMADGTWTCFELMPGGARENQRQTLKEENGWVFIELGELDQRPPNGHSAWLIPWQAWEGKIEPELLRLEMKSIRRDTTFHKDGTPWRLGADKLFPESYQLVWQKKVGKGDPEDPVTWESSWAIPKGHIWWKALHKKLQMELKKVEELI